MISKHPSFVDLQLPEFQGSVDMGAFLANGEELTLLERLGRLWASGASTGVAEMMSKLAPHTVVHSVHRFIFITKEFIVEHSYGRLWVILHNHKDGGLKVWHYNIFEGFGKYTDSPKEIRKIVEQWYEPYANNEELVYEISEFIEDYLI